MTRFILPDPFEFASPVDSTLFYFWRRKSTLDLNPGFLLHCFLVSGCYIVDLFVWTLTLSVVLRRLSGRVDLPIYT